MKEILVKGSGELPPNGYEIRSHYVGTFLDGSLFDSSRARGDEFKFKLGKGNVIKGWEIGFGSMQVGEKANLTCSPEYAYGPNGSPPKIPANSTLKFEVELLGFHPAKKDKWEMNPTESLGECENVKAQGTILFKAGKYTDACKIYEEALSYL
jgi:hypothetical protein